MDKKLLHTVVEHTAGVFPQNLAITHGTQQITYEALNAASTRVAECLIALGVTRESIVGIALESSIAYVAAIIGVMKAGGVFLPFDPSGPEERLAYILKKTVPQVIITGGSSARQQAGFGKHLGVWQETPPVVRVDTDLHMSLADGNVPEALERPRERLAAVPDADDSNYIMYTSGSTGKPKAIVGCHKSLSHFMHWEVQEFGFDASVKVTQLAPVTFDASLRDIFVPLISGGTLCIPQADDRKNAAQLIRWLSACGITVLHCVPSLFRLITKELERLPHPRQALPHLKYILMAGEPLYGRDVARWLDLMGNTTELVNFYGPSETTLIKTFFRTKEPPANLNAIVPVGFPIANTAILVINGERLCSIGEMGEIYIKTPFRSKGYYGDPDLTQAAFVQNPLNPDREDIVYRTGDLGRYLPDRCIEFVGRLDSQVKVNGMRIELAEIETTLLGCHVIDQTVVLAQSNPEGEQTLVCYYSLKEPASSTDVREYLTHKLPAYMLPAFYIYMDDFPLNINGKIDRRALPKPEDLIYEHTAYDPPTNDLEETLSHIWGEVLNLTKVGVNSPFFEIGGHSLKATRVISQVNRELGIDLSLKEFFEHDTVHQLSEYIRHQERRSLKPIPTVPASPAYNLSPMQRRLWLLDQMEDGSPAYNVPALYLHAGRLDSAAFRQAFGALVARHESLRTQIRSINGEPQQEILDRATALGQFDLEEIDLSGMANPEKAARQHAEADACQTFDLDHWPLFRLKLMKLAEASYALYFNIHHIICDAWSFDILAKELAALYGAYVSGHEPSLVPLRIQYKDYAAWQHDLLASEAFQQLKAYWHDRFAGDLVPLQLPTDHPRPPVQRYCGKTVHFSLQQATTEALNRLCHQCHTSLFSVLAALVKILLYRYTNQSDIVLGTPVAGRNHADLADQVGLFVNTLPLRDTISGDDTFAAVVAKVKQTTLEAYDHQGYPFDCLVDALPVPRDLSRSPLFDVMLVVQEVVLPQEMDVLPLKELPFEVNTSRFDLTFEVVPVDGQLHIGINYNSDLFRDDTVRRMGGHFTELANSVSTSADVPVRELELIPTAEREMLIGLFNRTSRAFPDDKTLVQLFCEQVARTPDHVAVVAGNQRLTYRQLHQQACRLAQLLSDTHTVKRDEIVALMVERGPRWIVGIIGIMMAGGAYLPLDPSGPRERTRFMLQDAACRLLLTENAFLAEAEHLSAAKVLDIDASAPGDDVANGFPQFGDASPENLAYVIYTSGSTGTPKGVMIEHRGFVNMITDQIRLFGVTASDRVLQFAAGSFDASLSEIFMTLLSGATLVIAPEETIHNPESFVRYLNDQQVTVATLPPSYLNALARRPLPTLQTLITAGEPPIVEDALFYAKNKTYINAYGPTEVSVCASVQYVSAQGHAARTIPIGKPIANTAIYVLDEASNLVPIGVPGEICVSGVGLARGYLNRSELTREKFMPHPFKPGERLYKTGDWGVWRPDGLLEFLGRKDEQVKLRGYRIELEEIRHTLLQHPAVKDAVVVLKGEHPASLVGYVVGQPGGDGSELKAFLREHLPEYMVPDHVLCLETLPLTAHGKIDRNALPHPASLSHTRADTRAPRNALEARLAGIWQDVLGTEVVGIDDNFFHAGGNSLQSIQLISKISTVLGVKISARELYLKPTIAELAEVLPKNPTLFLEASVVRCEAHQLSSEYQKIERHPLTELFFTGELAAVDAAALLYFPDYLVDRAVPEASPQQATGYQTAKGTELSGKLWGTASGKGLHRDVITKEWCHDRPVLSSITESSLGRIGHIMLPLFASELHSDPETLRRLTLQAVEMAGRLGAKTVSLTGLLPSATDHGRLLAAAMPASPGLPDITCGYATTAAAMVLTVERILVEGQRRLDKECVGLLGLGRMGTASLGLLLNVLPHPKEIILFDVFNRDPILDELPEKLADDYGFEGPIRVLETDTRVPSQLYEASLIIGATPVPGLLDVALLQPGTLVLQESGRDCILSGPAVQRFQATKDILFTEGDLLHAPMAFTSTIYLPLAVEEALKEAKADGLLVHQPFAITGCVLAGLLGSRYAHLRSAVDAGDLSMCMETYRTLKNLGFQAAGLHCRDYVLAAEDIASFREGYGKL